MPPFLQVKLDEEGEEGGKENPGMKLLLCFGCTQQGKGMYAMKVVI